MFDAEIILAHRDEVHINEARWLENNQAHILNIIEAANSDFLECGLADSLTDAMSRLPQDENPDAYCCYENIAPTLSADLMSGIWSDLVETGNNCSGPVQEVFGSELKGITRVINQFILPLSRVGSIRGGCVKAELGSYAGVAACSDAEGFFAQACQQIMQNNYLEQPKLSVYCDRSGRPIAFRKSLDISSALTLEPLDLYGSIVPAGSIIGIDRNEYKSTRPTLTSSVEIGKQLLQVFTIGDSFPIGLGRLSPWAYPDPLDRAMFAVNDFDERGVEIDENRLELAQGLELNSFRLAASRLIQLVDGASLEAQAA